MKNKKYQICCFLLSVSVAASSPAATIMAATRTGSAVVAAEVQQEVREEASEERDEDEIFQTYVASLFYQNPIDAGNAVQSPDKDHIFSPEYPVHQGISLTSLNSTGKSTLNATEKKLYNDLKPLITEVAEGKRTSTEFEINVSKYGNVFKFTADRGTTLTEDSIIKKFDAVVNKYKVYHALLADMPYELYWHDKTMNGWKASYSYSISYDKSTATITKLTIKMGVNAKYAEKTADGRSFYANQMSTDTQNTVRRAQKAAAKARSIVDENAGKSDYDKLYSYLMAICDLTSYNTSAPGNSTNTIRDGIDPWQLIYVFDGVSSTNVVCEGYAKAFAYLCDLSDFSSPDIACYTVSGTMKGGTGAGGHMWNIVTMDDNRNYLVDVTNCDKGTIGNPDKLFLAGLSGTAASSYTFNNGPGKSVTYTYDTEIKELYGTGSDSILTLADQKYSKKTQKPGTGAETEKITMDTAGNGTNVVIIVKKDGEGAVTSAEASVNLTGRNGMVTIDAATVQAIREAAGTDTEITMTVLDSKGKTMYSLTADSADLTAGNSMKVFQYSSGKGYALVNDKTYKVSKLGSVSVSLKEEAAYRLEDTKTAAKIEQQILNSVKPAKTSAKLKIGKSMKVSLAGSFHQENAKSISYSTTNKKVVKVSRNGTVKALKKGTASVKIKVVLKNGKTKTVTVNLTVK